MVDGHDPIHRPWRLLGLGAAFDERIPQRSILERMDLSLQCLGAVAGGRGKVRVPAPDLCVAVAIEVVSPDRVVAKIRRYRSLCCTPTLTRIQAHYKHRRSCRPKARYLRDSPKRHQGPRSRPAPTWRRPRYSGNRVPRAATSNESSAQDRAGPRHHGRGCADKDSGGATAQPCWSRHAPRVTAQEPGSLGGCTYSYTSRFW